MSTVSGGTLETGMWLAVIVGGEARSFGEHLVGVGCSTGEGLGVIVAVGRADVGLNRMPVEVDWGDGAPPAPRGKHAARYWRVSITPTKHEDFIEPR
jgi:hypothetical protein